jgi:two-component system, response regulator
MHVDEIEILLVEDSLSDAELTIRALKKKNMANRLVHVKDGAEALEFIFGNGQFEGSHLENRPKVVLLDLKLPKVDGFEVLRRLKSDDRTKAIPVVVLTSSTEEKDVIQSYKLGVNSYISKPVDFNKFIEAVSELGLYWLLLNRKPQ